MTTIPIILVVSIILFVGYKMFKKPNTKVNAGQSGSGAEGGDEDEDNNGSDEVIEL